LSYAPLLWNQSDEEHHRKQYQCNTAAFVGGRDSQKRKGTGACDWNPARIACGFMDS